LKQKSGIGNKLNLCVETNNYLIDKGIIDKPIPANYLIKLIDIHVPVGNRKKQCWGQLGFDDSIFKVNQCEEDYFKVISYKTYSHIKDPLSNKFWFWRKIKAILNRTYPADGGDFMAVVKKIHRQE
jgi:hypothetical protein